MLHEAEMTHDLINLERDRTQNRIPRLLIALWPLRLSAVCMGNTATAISATTTIATERRPLIG
jgi:uncharacterized membrane-anchored protein